MELSVHQVPFEPIFSPRHLGFASFICSRVVHYFAQILMFLSVWETFGNHCNEMFISSMVMNAYNLWYAAISILNSWFASCMINSCVATFGFSAMVASINNMKFMYILLIRSSQFMLPPISFSLASTFILYLYQLKSYYTLLNIPLIIC
jgi:hypothetical protein